MDRIPLLAAQATSPWDRWREGMALLRRLLVVGTSAAAVACGGTLGGGGLYPELAQFAGREVTDVDFTGGAPFGEDTLQTIVATAPTRCSILGLPFCIPGTGIGRERHFLDLGTLREDAGRLAAFYRQAGFFGTGVRPVVEPVSEEVRVTFFIDRGDPVTLDSLHVEGLAQIVDSARLIDRLPLRVGERFHLGAFVASGDLVREVLLARGHAYAEVLRNYGVDTITDRATASYLAIPGPQVVVDSIIVTGAEHLGRRSAIRQLTFRQGDLLRAQALSESQRNLYGLELVQLAAVTIAPDSLQRSPGDSTRASVIVRVAEGPVHVVDASVGYGSVDCFRSEARWVSRSFLGGARRLAITGSLSKIGTGEPLDADLENSLCAASGDDPFSRQVDYRLAADLTQPFFFSARNQLGLSAYTERRSEPNIYQREARGGRLAVSRRFGLRDVLTGAVEGEFGRTRAEEAIFCLAFSVCEPGDIRQLQVARWRTALGVTWARDRTNTPLNPTEGYQLRTGTTWGFNPPGISAPSVEFLRWTAEASAYEEMSPEWVVAANLRLGSFLGSGSVRAPDNFLPPEERFYAGGANSVRGYDRNSLGPGVYVVNPVRRDTLTQQLEYDPADAEFVPIGGTALGIGSAELRFPSPLFRRFLRLALFIDAGAIGTRELWDLDLSDIRATPGLGFRLNTPVGPARLDVAYNPYDLPGAPLFGSDPLTGSLLLLEQRFSRPAGSFFQRLKFHFAIGQPF